MTVTGGRNGLFLSVQTTEFYPLDAPKVSSKAQDVGVMIGQAQEASGKPVVQASRRRKPEKQKRFKAVA